MDVKVPTKRQEERAAHRTDPSAEGMMDWLRKQPGMS